ncbi:MAG: ShlB/FhaC/HecB family hemolysin secretion/activation protein [Marinomonas sp.]
MALFAAGTSVSAQEVADPFEGVSGSQDRMQPQEDSQADIALPAGASPRIEMDFPMTVAAQAAGMTIGAVNIAANADVPRERLAQSYQAFIGMEANEENLRALASAVSTAAREEGYIFASAEVPPQSVKIGVVSVNLDPGSIDEVRILGSDNSRLRAILNELVNNDAKQDLIERQLLLAGDLPGIRIKDTQFQREGDAGILVVTVDEDRISGRATLDNYGPDTLGPYRARLSYSLAGLLSDDDVFSASLTNTLLNPKELAYVRIRYARTLNAGSTVVGFSGAAGRTLSGGRLSDLKYRGRNRSASIFANQAIVRSNDMNLWLNAEVAYRQVLQSQAGIGFQDDRITTASLNFAGNANIGIGRIYGGIGVTQGLGVLGASEAGDPMNSRSNADGTFTKANAWVNTLIDIGDTFGLRLAANAQIASAPLLASEEMGLGGAYFGRGYDFSENYGDEGIIGLAEFRMGFSNVTDWLDWVQLYSFVDGGYVNHIGTGFGDGSLSSAGGGLRAQIGKFDLGAEVAKPISDDRFESGDKSPKVNMQVGVRF